jgi:hypothetical protein
MLVFLIILLALMGTLGSTTLLHALEKAKNTPELAPVEEKKELEVDGEWLEEDWDSPAYVDVIHTTQKKEQEALGYVVTVCLCNFHDTQAKANLEKMEAELAREKWLKEWDIDIDEVNAVTRAQKLETYRTYYCSKDEPGYKPVEEIQYEKFLDKYGREHMKIISVPPATYRKDFVPDPYSQQMRLKEELFVLQNKLSRLTYDFSSSMSGSNLIASTRQFEEYKKINDRIRFLKEQLAGNPSKKYQDTITKRYSRGGEVVEYVMEDAYGKVIKRWKDGRY